MVSFFYRCRATGPSFKGGYVMDSGMIGKILKAKRYAQERERIEFTQFSVVFHGENNDHKITYQTGDWNCTCDFFASHGVCSHTMALERVLGEMIHPAEESVADNEAITEPA
jgi:hypothetical protein